MQILWGWLYILLLTEAYPETYTRIIHRACGVKEETSAHILCECEALASLRHTYLGSFFLEPEDIKSISLGAVCSYGRATRLLWFWYGEQRARLKGLGALGPRGPVPTCNSIHIPAEHSLKLLRQSLCLYACNNSRITEWILMKCDIEEFRGGGKQLELLHHVNFHFVQTV